MLFINARIHTMENDVTIENGYILIENGKISSLGEMLSLNGSPDVPEIDLHGKSVYPGFVDAHTHIGMWEDGLGFEGDDGNEETDPVTPHLRALDAVNGFDRCFEEAIEMGITTVVTGPGSANAIGGQMAVMKTWGGLLDDLVIAAPFAMKMSLGENPKTVYNGKNQAPITRMATAALIREALFKAQEYLKTKEDKDSSPPDFDFKCEALLPVLKKEIPVHFHVHRRDDILTAVRIAKEFALDYVLVHCTDGHLVADFLVKEQAKVLAGPLITDRPKPEMKNATPALPYSLWKAGVFVGIITDHPVVPIRYLPLCAGLAAAEGLPIGEALKAITIYPATICGLADRVGSIAPGKDADFVIYPSNCSPLDLDALPEQIYINGILVKENRRK